MAEKAKPRVGIIGCGYWGKNLVRTFNALPGCELVACCDRNQDLLASYRREYPNVQFSDDLDEVLAADLNACVVATPAEVHYEVAKKCLEKIRELCSAIVRGNHDHYCAHDECLEDFHPLAANVVDWTRRHMTEEQISFLRIS